MDNSIFVPLVIIAYCLGMLTMFLLFYLFDQAVRVDFRALLRTFVPKRYTVRFQEVYEADNADSELSGGIVYGFPGTIKTTAYSKEAAKRNVIALMWASDIEILEVFEAKR